MANEFIVRKGLKVKNDTEVTGSIYVSETGSFGYIEATKAITTASYAETASYALNAGEGNGAGFPFEGNAVITGSLVISGSGNIGSGIDVPLSRLHLYDDSAAALSARIEQEGSGIASLLLSSDGGDVYSQYTSKNTGSWYVGSDHSDNSKLKIDWDNSDFSNPILIIDNTTGYTGIGKSDPEATLDVNGNAYITGSLNISESVSINNHKYFQSFTTGGSKVEMFGINPSNQIIFNRNALTAVDDINTGLLFIAHNNNNFEFRNSDNLAIIRIEPDPVKFGIGKSDPQETLDVSGSVYITGSLNMNGDLFIEGAANPTLLLDEGGERTNYFQILQDTDTRVKIEHIHASSGLIDMNPRPSNGTGTGGVRLFRESNTTGYVGLEILRGDGTATLNHRFAGQVNKSYINADNPSLGLGIGKSDPQETLDVSGSVYITGSLNMNGDLFIINTKTDQPTLYISGSGGLPKIGIATTNPSRQLHISGSSSETVAILLESPNSGATQFRMKSNHATNKRFLAEDSSGVTAQIIFTTSDSIEFWGTNSSYKTVSFDTLNKRLSVNKLNPQATLDINGNAYISGSLNVSGSVISNRSYGSAYMETTQSLILGTTPVSSSNTTAGPLNDFIHTPGRLTYTGDITKVFTINNAVYLVPESNAAKLLSIYKNGTLPNSGSIARAGSIEYSLNATIMVDLSQNDYIETFYKLSSDLTSSIHNYSLNIVEV